MRQWLSRPLAHLARLLGYDLVPLPVPSERLDVHLSRLFTHLSINCVLDVGANQGQYGARLRQMGYNGYIISFEPAIEDFKQLQRRCAADDGWEAYNLALGAQEGNIEMNIYPDTLFNSFLRPNTAMRNLGLQVGRVETVPVQRLDMLFDTLVASMAEPRVYLKLDTQGYDLKVLEGATRTLPMIRALQTEVAVKPLYEGMPDYLEAIQTISRLGFEVTGLFPVARDGTLRVVEFDCVMVNSRAVGEFSTLYPP